MHILPSFYAGYIISVHRIVTDCIVLVNSHVCWTYSHHCQIADMKPSQRIMERRISGGSYMCWMDFHNAILCCGFLCARLILRISLFCVYFVSILCLFCLFSLFSGYHAAGYHAPSILHGLSRPGLSRLHHHCTATTPVYIFPGYHAIVLSSIPRLSHLSYHAPPHKHVHRVITPAIVSCL